MMIADKKINNYLMVTLLLPLILMVIICVIYKDATFITSHNFFLIWGAYIVSLLIINLGTANKRNKKLKLKKIKKYENKKRFCK